MAKNGRREERLYRNLTLKRGSSRPLTVVLGLLFNVSSHDPFSVSRGQRVLWGGGGGVLRCNSVLTQWLRSRYNEGK